MAERYRIFERAYWDHKKIIPLKWELKLFYPYFFCNKHDHISGLYTVRISYISEETGLPEKRVIAMMRQLIEEKFLFYDWKRFVVFVPSMLERQIRGKMSPQITGAIRAAITEYSDHPFSRLLLERYGLLEQFEGILRTTDTLSIGYQYLASPSPSPSQSQSKGDSKGESGKRIHIDKLELTDSMKEFAAKNGINGHAADVFAEMSRWAYKNNKLTNTQRGWAAQYQTFVKNAHKYNPEYIDQEEAKPRISGIEALRRSGK